MEAIFAALEAAPLQEDVRVPLKSPHVLATGDTARLIRFRHPGAEVSEDLMLKFRAADGGEARLSPDVAVKLDTPRHPRADYRVEELGPPDFVMEVLSRGTWERDAGEKLDEYERIGVREVLLFDPTGERLAGRDLWGYALGGGERAPLAEVRLPNGRLGVRSDVLDLTAYAEKAERPWWGYDLPRALVLRWFNPETGGAEPVYEESRANEAAAVKRADAERKRATAQRARADAAEARIAELERQLRERDAP